MAGPSDFYGQTPALWGAGDYPGQGALTPFLNNPMQVGLLSAASGLIRAGGPSPVPVSLSQALAQGIQAGLGGYAQTQQANLQNKMLQAHGALYQQQARKAALDAAMTEQAMKSGLFAGGGDPDQLEALGLRLAAGGHPGSATLIAQSDKRRTLLQNQQAVDSMRSAPGTLGAGVVTSSPQGQALLANLSGDPSFDQAVLAAQNEALNSNTKLAPQPVAAPRPGLYGALANSPYVGQAAQAMQAQLDVSKGIPAQTWLEHYGRLQAQDQTATNQAIAREENAAVRRELASQADNTRRELAGQSDETRRMIAAMASGNRDSNRQNLQDQRNFSNERSLANDFNNLSKDFRVVLPSFQASARYIASGKFNSSGDRDLAFSYARTLDPKDRVGVNDIKDINKLGNVPERIQQAIVALAEGKQLPDRVRLEMFGAMRNRFQTMNEQQQDIEDEYEKRAQQYMLTPGRVVQRFAIRNSTPARQSGSSGGWSATRE